MNDIKNHPDYQNLSLKYKLAIRYIRNKTNQLLDVLGTMPLLADDITDDDLIKIDPIGIVSDTFATVLENLKDTNKNLEGALTEIEAILNATPAGIMIIDAQNRTIVNTNPSAEEIIGLSKNEIIGKKCCLFFCIDNKNECPVLDHNQTLNRCERNIIDSHGEMKTIIKSVKPITIKDKMFLVESFLDITENKRMFQELIKSQRIESLSLLAGGIAHDFNNALMAILGNISLAKNMIPEGDKAYDRLAKAEKAVEKAQLLSKQLLTFSKGGAPVLKKASIGDILIDTVNFASSGKNMKVIFDLKHELPILQIDEVQISQVFQNLTINASEAMTNGGILYVSACTVDNVYFNKNPKIKNFVKISFKDTGSGIKPELIDRIFDPFFTTKKTGSGLGLSTTYTVIKNHEGHIFVESSDKGTEFTIYLPILSDENIDTFTSQNESKKPSTVQTKLTKGKILVLEDKEDVSSVMRDMFEVFGYETAVFTIGEDLISTYKQHLQANDKIDFVILDLTIPGAMGGIETMQRLKQIDPNVKAFISTGYDAEQALKENKKYGFIGCISKPFKIDDIKAILSQI